MSKVDQLFSRVQQVKSSLESILRVEEDIDEKEREESAELQKAEKIASALSSTQEREVLEEEIADFVEAVKLFRTISKELHNTANDIHQVIDKINSNAEDEYSIIEGLSNDNLRMKTDKAGELAETINATHINIEKLIGEADQAKREAQKAQTELEELAKLDRFIEKIDEGMHDLSGHGSMLNQAKNDLQHAERKLGEVPDKLEAAKNNSERTLNELRSNTSMERRKFVKGAGALGASAIVGLPGCLGEGESQSEREIIQNPSDFENQEIAVQGIPEYNGERSYTEWVYSPATKSSVPVEVTDPTYILHAKSGQILFKNENRPELLNQLKKGEKLDHEVEITGTMRKAGNEEGEMFYVIAESKVKPL